MDDKERPPEEQAPEKGFLTLLGWRAEEYEYHEKSPDWYWSVGILTLGFLFVAILLSNILFAILVLIAGFSVAMYGTRRPKEIDFAITSRGIKIGDKLYEFDGLNSFWINYDPPHVRELYILSKKVLMPQISIPLGATDPNEVREHLIKFLEEKEIPESFFDTIARFFRF